jgi:hypothetical protein
MLRFDEQHLLAVCGNKPALGLNYDYFTTRGGDVEIRRVGGLALRHGIAEFIFFVLILDAFARKVGGDTLFEARPPSVLDCVFS